MKFGDELIAERVPEWADKYLDYKAGKRLIKGIADAIAREESGHSRHQQPPALTLAFPDSGTVEEQPLAQPQPSESATVTAAISPRTPPADRDPRVFISRDPSPTTASGSRDLPHGPSFPPTATSSPARLSTSGLRLNVAGLGLNRYAEPPPEMKGGELAPSTPSRESSRLPSRTPSRPATPPRRTATQVRRHARAINALFSSYPFSAVRTRFFDGAMQPLNSSDPIERLKTEFFHFMLTELQKVEAFYKTKVDEAGTRLHLLRQQLYEMRNHKGDDVFKGEIKRHIRSSSNPLTKHLVELTTFRPGGPKRRPSTPTRPVATPILTALSSPSDTDRRRDFVPRPVVVDEKISYTEAKRKLKTALHELYRTLTLIQSYAELNRTAFRKLNKKYDKNARTNPEARLEFVRHYVDDMAGFAVSTEADEQMRTAEDLFARYFERGDGKAAVAKLRRGGAGRKGRDESKSSFFNGLLVGLGVVFSVQGLISALKMLFDEDMEEERRKVVASHLQLYGGYFLMVCMGWLFCLVCVVWNRAKVNYQFVFEFDQRHTLDWRKLAQFPSLFTLMFGGVFWTNFCVQWRGDQLFLWYPVVLIGASLVIIFLPLPVFHHKSRLWFVYSHWRLLMAPFYRVEFRDVFLADIYCSLRYAIANSELFFCVHIEGWDEPEKCGSSKSRLMAFLSALPPMWRAIQCLRRYYDSRSAFPHLANFTKYLISIMSIVGLSIYRIDGTEISLTIFILFSTLATVFSSYWDIYMDFRLAQKKSKGFLRDILAFQRKSVYYGIMVADPVMRMTWLLYIFFSHDIQHSGALSYFIAVVEIFRRALWMVLRVENEHCVNIAQNKASRDVPLPYRIPEDNEMV